MDAQGVTSSPPECQPGQTKPDLQSEAYQKTISEFRLFMLADRGVRPTTADTYVRILKRILKDCGTPAPDPYQLRVHIATLRDRSYSHSHIANVCRVVEAYTESLGHKMTLARGKRGNDPTVESLTEGEVAVILSACRTVRERAILSILAYSGMRNDELCRLKTEDVNIAEQSIHIRNGKGGNGRSVRVSGQCVSDIQAYLAEYCRRDGDLLFVSEKQRRPFVGTTVRRIVKKVVARTMIRKRVHPHTFRHSLAVNMLSRGASIFAIRDILGHSDIATTMIYLRSADSRVAAQYQMYCPSYS